MWHCLQLKPTWAGRYASSQLSAVLTTLSLDLASSSSSSSAAAANAARVIHQSEKLPHDAFQLLPIPEPVGGALVACASMLVHVNQSFSCGLRLNEFGDKQDRPYLKLTANAGPPTHFDAARFAVLDATRVLCAAASGATNGGLIVSVCLFSLRSNA